MQKIAVIRVMAVHSVLGGCLGLLTFWILTADH